MNEKELSEKIKAFLAKGGKIETITPVATVAEVKAKHPDLARKILAGERGDHKTNSKGYVPDEDL